MSCLIFGILSFLACVSATDVDSARIIFSDIAKLVCETQTDRQNGNWEVWIISCVFVCALGGMCFYDRFGFLPSWIKTKHNGFFPPFQRRDGRKEKFSPLACDPPGPSSSQ
jgi:hypothetical protein